MGARFVPNVEQAQKSIWTNPIVLLGDEAQLEARSRLFKDIANLDARKVHSLYRTYHSLRNHFGRTQWNSKVTWIMRNLILVHFEIVLVSVQDRCRFVLNIS
jgi:hypothetical protein